MRHVVVGVGIAAVTFLVASLGFLATALIFEYPFGALYRMHSYHEQNPFQYIGVVAVTFGFFGAIWLQICGRIVGWRRWITILFTILLTILVACVPGGVLWTIHDMQAGWFPEGAQFWNDIQWGAEEGLRWGWAVIIASFPYNLFGLVTGGLFLHYLPAIVSWTYPAKN